MSSTTLAKRAIIDSINQYQGQIALALPRHLSPERFTRIVVSAVQATPALLSCDKRSLFGAIITASALGLEPNSPLGHCYLIPRGGVVTLLIGYRGMIELAARARWAVQAQAVDEADEFVWEHGLHPVLRHVPSSTPTGRLSHVYAIAKKVEEANFCVMTKSQVDAVRGRSGAKSGPWVTDYEEMAKKTAIRRLFKYLSLNTDPFSADLARAAQLDEYGSAGIDQGFADLIEVAECTEVAE